MLLGGEQAITQGHLMKQVQQSQGIFVMVAS